MVNMNNLDLSKVNNVIYMFYNMKEINYLEIKETKFNDKINEELKGEYGLNDKNDLLVCKNEENLSIENYKSICCKYDIGLKKCGNYIICKYKETTEYAEGFQNKYRNNIAYVKNETSIVCPNERLIIEANTTIEIYFSELISSLKHFFSGEGSDDPKAKNIKLIDLSHFDSSSVNDIESKFLECSSLEEINFNNFNTSKITNMGSMFYKCSKLKSLDLSNFDTSKVEYMMNMFSGCTSLEYLDISNFNTLNITQCEDMFGEVNPLKYINLYNSQIEKIKEQIKEKKNPSTIVCQNVEILSNLKNDCSIFTQSDNYIIVKYGNQTTYETNEFKFDESRQNIQYIK